LFDFVQAPLAALEDGGYVGPRYGKVGEGWEDGFVGVEGRETEEGKEESTILGAWEG